MDGTEQRVKKERIVLERDNGRRLEARKEEKGKRKVAKVTQSLVELWENWTHPVNYANGSWNKSLNAAEEDKGDITEEVHEDEDELHAWCLLEESENEQEVTSKKSKLKLKKLDHVSLLSVEKNSCASPRNVIEVKDNWVIIRATMHTRVAGHVMLAETFSQQRNSLQRMEKRSMTWVRKPYHSSPMKECTSASNSGAQTL